MKSAALAICLLSFIGFSTQEQTPQQIHQQLLKFRDECMKESGVEVSAVTSADQGQFDDSNKKLQCFAKCFYQKQGYIDESATLLISAIEAKLPAEHKEQALADVKKCEGMSGVDACEKGYKIHKCFFENIRARAAAAQAKAPTA
ncbi:unnamed protein product [Brassicogethes aeneus]|uniref:Uncharacterized protein n=1 Tax=Brassicogethes aeneus TaxID=1431903 RepID=A0A9P0AZ59_BRAAE|nr:unnamed protein product [Brassicogethes aeneus]